MGASDDKEMDYNVDVKLRITFINKEFNCLLKPEMEKSILGLLGEINGSYLIEESDDVEFMGDEEAIATYSFNCNDVSPAEAESFARSKIHEAEDQFKAMGYTLKSESYHAEEADMGWLDEWERQIFG